MNSRYLLSAIMQIIFLLFFIEVTVAQVVVEVSKDKVVIAGRQYYVHTVKKGETAYSISKAYGITVEELIRENPPAVYGIKDGQLLQVPVAEIRPDQSANVPVNIRVNKDEEKFIYHKLNAGETVYFLSRKYGVSENEILTSNPGMDINKISIGTEIAIPRRGLMIEKQKFDSQEITYSYHKVARGESLSDIASKYGISVRELRRANRGLIFPRVNDYVRIPGQVLVEKVLSDTVITDTSKIAVDTLPLIVERPAGYTPVKNLSDTFDVALLLPLYLAENAKRTTIDSSRYLKGK
jgi:LysM repeat protein